MARTLTNIELLDQLDKAHVNLMAARENSTRTAARRGICTERQQATETRAEERYWAALAKLRDRLTAQ